jgi:transcriptional regulator with XRE-family HTH domain
MRDTEVGRYERGDREPRLTSILRIARSLGVPPSVLLDPLALRSNSIPLD